MYARKILASAFVAIALVASIAEAQQPLMTQVRAQRYGDTFRQGTVVGDIYSVLVEPVISMNGQVDVMFATNGGNLIQDRVRRYPKEELHYNAVIWGGVPPGTYTVEAMVTWPDGVGAVTGSNYSAGFVILQYNVTITP